MKAYLIKSILPRMGLYADYRGVPQRKPGLSTIPRVPIMPTKVNILDGLNEVGHYGTVREVSREYRQWLLSSHFNPWAAAWLESSVYLWWAQTYTEAEGGGGYLPWISSIITSDNRSAEDEVHELGHHWEEYKAMEGCWTPQQFTQEVWLPCVGQWPLEADKVWAEGFAQDPLKRDPEGYNETYASTCSRIMGDLSRLPEGLLPHFKPLFQR